MNFEKVSIVNFRNFKNIEVEVSNKNVFFGLNDIGKTNFLCALRYVFDKDIRRNGLIDSDFHEKNTKNPIEIIVTLDISDTENEDCQKLRAQLKGALLSTHDKVYIKLIAEYNSQDLSAIPILYWGGDLAHLHEMKQRGYLYELDYVFNVIYVDSYIDMYSLFKKNIKTLVKSDSDSDDAILLHIQDTVSQLNSDIASLSGVKEFESKITPEYQKFRNEGVSVSVKSEIAVKGLYSNIIPYIKQEGDDNLYPTAGEGRKKLLAYSIYDLIASKSEELKINIFLIEEPENHLHKSLQIALSYILFTDERHRYLFVTTHSPFVLYEMDNVSMIRIFNNLSIKSESYFYTVPDEYKENRNMLNRGLAEAIFANKVLLVEGPSELLLFEKILSVVHPFYESDGVYVLAVGGISFKIYIDILSALKIKTIVKTDNDLRYEKSSDEYSVLGFLRCNKIIGDNKLPTDTIKSNTIADKRKLYSDNTLELDKIRSDYNVFLSKADLENDLDEFLHNELVSYLGVNDPVEYLQKAKHYRMAELIEKITDTDCKKIYNNYNFACLKEVLE